MTVRPDSDVQLRVWRPGTRSVRDFTYAERRRDLVGQSVKTGTQPESVTATSSERRGSYVYVEIFLARNAARAGYTLTVATRAAPR